MAPTQQPRVAIIGAGVGGITTAIELQSKYGIKATLYERNAGPGGTWYNNTYPGCACDVRSHWYSLSTEQNPDWSSAFAAQPEIRAYWDGIFAKHKLGDQTLFNTVFVRADWVAERNLYVIQFADANDKSKTFTEEAEVLVSAIGGFSTPIDKPVGMTGLEDFKGSKFHSARWDPSVNLQGKRVAVIGSGCSGAQIVPKISEEPTTHVINFARSPGWYLPRPDTKFSSTTKAAFRYVPGLQRAFRWFNATRADCLWLFWPVANEKWRKNFAEKGALEYMKSIAPKEYHEFLTPDYPFGCKRIIIDPGFLDSLNRPNVELVWDPISKITERGILCASGKEHELDVIVLATGFDLTARGLGLPVYGKDGRSLSEYWATQGGPQAYLGTTVTNYPNFFSLLGPNVATGHTSALAHIESQIHYFIKMMNPIVNYGVKSLELKPQAEKDYNDWLQAKLQKTVWGSGCSNWYRLKNGKIVGSWPGTYAYFWWVTRSPNFKHYIPKGGSTHLTLIQRRGQLWSLILFTLMYVVLPYFSWAYGARLLVDIKSRLGTA